MRLDDEIRLRHMLEAAEIALEFASKASRQSLETDRMRTFAIVRAVEIIGEAAGKVSEETRQGFPQLPWPAMTAMRNRVIHAYFDVDLDRVWDTVTQDLPPLIGQLEAALRSSA